MEVEQGDGGERCTVEVLSSSRTLIGAKQPLLRYFFVML